MKSWKSFWLALAFAFSSLTFVACGDSADDTIDFIEDEIEDGSPIGACDASACPSGTTAVANGCEYAGDASTVTVSGKVVDFQTDRARPGAVLYLMDNDTGKPTDVCTVSNESGAVSIVVPADMKIGFGTKFDGAKDTYQFNQQYGDDTADEDFLSVSEVTAQLIPGIIGTSPDETKGTIAGTVYNRFGKAVTDSAVEENHDFKVRTVSGQEAYYFNDKQYPANRQDEPVLNTNGDGDGTGLFTIFDVPIGAVDLELVYGDNVSATTDSSLFAFKDSISISNITCVDCN